MQLRLPATTTQHDFVQLGGGLDLLTPLLKLKAGYVRDALNWDQSINGGYSRIAGYERNDGRAAPSSATYLTITASIVGAVTAGITITGATSGATGKVLSVDVTSGVSVIAYTQATGAFVLAENITNGGVVGTITVLGGAGTGLDYDATQRSLAANVYRALIAAVPGTGDIRGGFFYGGVNYAFRNNAGATALALYKSSGAGWVLVPYLNEVSFTAGSVAPVVGAVITQGANSATVRAISIESGSFAGTNAAGRFIVTVPAPGNFVAGALTGGGTATLSGASTVITLLPGGHVQTDMGNFDGTVKVYGCDGVNLRAWQFDGTTLAPIAVAGNTIPPQAVLVHKDHLWLAFNNNLQNSSIVGDLSLGGAPFTWTAVTGSASYRCEGRITGLLRQPGEQAGGAMSISTSVGTEMIYGSSAANFTKTAFEQSSGARPYSSQRLGGQSLIYGDAGILSLSATQSFGNFAPAAMTMNIRPFTEVRRTLCTGSLVNKSRSQYRVFFSDGYGLFMTLVNGRLMGTMPVFFPNKVTACWQGDSPDGSEASYFGSDNGMVYRLDLGTSHDGAELVSYFTLTFANQGNSRKLKAYKRATFECQGDGYAEFDVTYELGYAGADRPQGVVPDTSVLPLGAVYWDAFTWDTFTWDGRTLGPDTIELRGTGENIALRIDSASDKFLSFTLNSITIDYILRRSLRT